MRLPYPECEYVTNPMQVFGRMSGRVACKNCGLRLGYDSTSGWVKCPNCGAESDFMFTCSPNPPELILMRTYPDDYYTNEQLWQLDEAGMARANQDFLIGLDVYVSETAEVPFCVSDGGVVPEERTRRCKVEMYDDVELTAWVSNPYWRPSRSLPFSYYHLTVLTLPEKVP